VERWFGSSANYSARIVRFERPPEGGTVGEGDGAFPPHKLESLDEGQFIETENGEF
jgi:uncharacterized protein YndB with AHSA1/START domain